MGCDTTSIGASGSITIPDVIWWESDIFIKGLLRSIVPEKNAGTGTITRF